MESKDTVTIPRAKLEAWERDLTTVVRFLSEYGNVAQTLEVASNVKRNLTKALK